jgi:hypothetical protein
MVFEFIKSIITRSMEPWWRGQQEAVTGLGLREIGGIWALCGNIYM